MKGFFFWRKIIDKLRRRLDEARFNWDSELNFAIFNWPFGLLTTRFFQLDL